MTAETRYTWCRRRVADGKARIARQEHLIACLSRTGETQMIERAVAFLVILLEIQIGHETRLAAARSRLSPTAPPAATGEQKGRGAGPLNREHCDAALT